MPQIGLQIAHVTSLYFLADRLLDTTSAFFSIIPQSSRFLCIFCGTFSKYLYGEMHKWEFRMFLMER